MAPEIRPSLGRARAWPSRIASMLLALVFLDCSGCPPEAIVEGPGTAEFLDEDDFSGDFTARTAGTEFGGEAIFNGRIVFTNLKRTIVEEVLPPDLHLAPRVAPLTSSGADVSQHPVAMTWGHQTHTSVVYPFWTPEMGEDYQELILVIPFVQKEGSSLWHNYVVRMYVNDDYAYYAGNLYYGVRKERASFAETATDFDVLVASILTFESQAVATGPWIPNAEAEESLLNYQDMKEIWAMPLMGTLTYSPGKPNICLYFEWYFDAAEVRPISTNHVFKQEFVTGMMSWVSLGPVSSVEAGAWEVKGLRWRLGFPAIPCKY